MSHKSESSLSFDLVFVPQGAELQAVKRGLAKANLREHPPVISLPIGPQAVGQRLAQVLPTLSFQIPCHALVLGVAGSLAPAYGVGDTVVYQTLCVDSLDPPCPCDPKGIQHIRDQLPWVQTVVALTSDRMISSSQEKQQLHQRLGAGVVDMEGMALVQGLQAQQIRVTMVRVISDGPDQNIPDISPALRADGSLNGFKLGIIMVTQPIGALHLIYGSLKALKGVEQVTTQIFAKH
jgi:hypothetical protein